MKLTTVILVSAVTVLTIAPSVILAQQALKTDSSGNPTTPLNLGGGNVTGTLAAARLPAGIGAPAVQMISQAQGSVVLATGVTVVVLTVPLTGTLNLSLPASQTYPAGRALIVVDPAGYSSANKPVNVIPAGGDLLNGVTSSAGAIPLLAGTGANILYPDGVNRWSTGQSYLRAPTAAGLTLAGSAANGNNAVFSILNGTGTPLFSVLGDGSVGASTLNVDTVFSSDAGSIYTDGESTLEAGTFLADSNIVTYVCDFHPVNPANVAAPSSGGRLCVGTDGKLHVRTADNVDHVVSWTVAP